MPLQLLFSIWAQTKNIINSHMPLKDTQWVPPKCCLQHFPKNDAAGINLGYILDKKPIFSSIGIIGESKDTK